MLSFDEREIAQGITLLSLKGRLDALTAPDLRPTIDSIVSGARRRVVCDLHDLETIDSSGVGAIVSLFKRSRMKGGDVKIARLRGQPKEIFRLLRLDRAFELFEEIEPAIQRLTKQK
jgi:anti-sigma B factor antagonist